MRSSIRLSIYLTFVATLTAPTLLHPAPVAAQELALYGVMATSNDVEFPSPVGVGASALKVVGSDWLLRLSYVRTYDSTLKPGVVCITYSPRIGCHTEPVSTTDSFSGLRFGFMRALHLGSVARLGAGVGISLNAIHIDARAAADGHAADLERPLTAVAGYLGMVHLNLTPVPSLPLGLTAGYQLHRVLFEACSDVLYAPFCGAKTFREVDLGLFYRIG